VSSSFLNVFRSRRSVEEYLPKEVSEEGLFRILEAGRWAPSAHNAQPWRFIVIRDSATKQRLVKAMATSWNKDMGKDGVLKEERESLIRASIERFDSAPIIVIACLTMENMDEYPDERRKRVEYIMAVQSVAAAIENMLLAAHGEGLGSCWFCAPLFCQGAVRNILNIPQYVDPQALITLGYPADRPNPPPRKTLGEVVMQDHWGHAT
jgi:coenzyme F420-0:L-glutamate ligase/coenzyme F420-1:gamma-L-glutamate ligase